MPLWYFNSLLESGFTPVDPRYPGVACSLPTPQSARTPAFVWRTHLTGERSERMLWTIFVILLVLWLLGVVSSYTIGGFIHLLLVLALVVLLINIIGGRRTVV